MQEIQVISLDEDGLLLVENISNYGRKEITNFIRYDSTLTGCGDTNTSLPAPTI
jgi:hypothetical protein